VPTSEWEDPTTLKPALAAAHSRLDTLIQATSNVVTALQNATAQAGSDATSCDKLLSALESAEVLSQKIIPRQDDKEVLERLYRAAHDRLENELRATMGQPNPNPNPNPTPTPSPNPNPNPSPSP
jgi:hypothetical protein